VPPHSHPIVLCVACCCVSVVAYHLDSTVRNFNYTMAEEPSSGLTSFDATNALWARLSEAKMSSVSADVPSTPTSQLTSALSHFQFPV